MSAAETAVWRRRLVEALRLRDDVTLDTLEAELPLGCSVEDMEVVLDGLEDEGIDPFAREGGLPGRSGPRPAFPSSSFSSSAARDGERFRSGGASGGAAEGEGAEKGEDGDGGEGKGKDREDGKEVEEKEKERERDRGKEKEAEPVPGSATILSHELEGSLHQAERPLEELDDEERVARLIAEFLPLVHHQARAFRRCGLPYQDLVQGGCEGLVQAATRWSPAGGKRFRSKATWWIRQGFLKVISESRSFVRVPKALQRQIGRMTRTVEGLRQELRRIPTSAEIGRRLKMPVEWVDAVRHLLASPLSLEAPVPGMDATVLGDMVEDAKAPGGTGHREARAEAEATMDRLSALPLLERRILMLRFGIGDGLSRSVDEVAELTGLSRREVSELQERALEALRGAGAEGTLP